MLWHIPFTSFSVSVYFLLILFAFITCFIVFRIITKDQYSLLDAGYLYSLNILGFFIGSKLLFFLDTRTSVTFLVFLDSGYSFVGGLLGSIVVCCLYCRRFKLNKNSMLVQFTKIYPLLYAICKIGCYLNGCCSGKGIIPIQIIEAISFFLLFILLCKLQKVSMLTSIRIFSILFFTMRFIFGFFRAAINPIFLGLNATQLVCLAALLFSFVPRKSTSTVRSA